MCLFLEPVTHIFHFSFSLHASFVLLLTTTFVESLSFLHSLNYANYEKVEVIVRETHPQNDKKTLDCILDDLKVQKVVDRFNNLDFVNDIGRIKRELQPYIEDAKLNCEHQEEVSPSILNDKFVTNALISVLLAVIVFGWIYFCIRTVIFLTKTNK